MVEAYIYAVTCQYILESLNRTCKCLRIVLEGGLRDVWCRDDMAYAHIVHRRHQFGGGIRVRRTIVHSGDYMTVRIG